MRRDYFSCVFLLCVCAALFFVCFSPLYFTYGMIVPREFGTLELIAGWVYAVSVLAIIPGYAAYKKKIWITAGLAAYGFLALLPTWIMPSLSEKLAGEGSSIVNVLEGFVLRCIYAMVNAPFAATSKALGDVIAEGLSRKILPVALILYIIVQVFRFYRDAYVAEQLDPTSVVDSTARENNKGKNGNGRNVRDAKVPEVLGTVISAPVKNEEKQAAPVREPAVREPAVRKPVREPVREAVRKPQPEVPVHKEEKPQVEAPAADKAPAVEAKASSDTEQVIRLGPHATPHQP